MLRFDIRWYGEVYDAIRACSNGWVTLERQYEGTAAVLPRPPNAGEPNPLLLVNNLDLNPSAGGQMWFWTDRETQAVVSWINVPYRYNNNVRTSFQVILNENGFVKYQYGTQTNFNGSLSNIGYENHDGTVGASIIYREAERVHEGLAIEIVPAGEWVRRWATLSPPGGVLSADSEQDVSIILDAGVLEAGQYDADLHIVSNDPQNEDVVVTIEMTVGNVPDISTDPEELVFGEVDAGDSEIRVLTINNDGDEDLTVTDVYVDGNFFVVDFEEESVTIGPGEDYELSVTFEPNGIGKLNATLVIISDDPNEQEFYVPLSGVGLGEGWI